ncbi:MAG: ABC transporter permease subunit, partial [Kiritimatiellae bacterium]|nr:ABC transporter permease subunit [Kiritimatiellia bacterium]
RGLGGGGSAQVEGGGARGSPETATDTVRRQLNEYFGFDKPLHVRYREWLVRDVCGLRAHSWHYPDKTAWQLVRDRIPVSLWFGIPGFFLAYIVCIPLGVAKAVWRGTRFDVASSVVVFAGYAIPAFALGMAMKTLFCGTVDGLWDILPLGGLESDGYAAMPPAAKVADRAAHMALPVLCYMAGAFAMLTLLVKNSLLDQLSADYVRTVLAKGATLRRAVWAHALRNALVPVATGFGGILTVFFAGSVVIERVFEIPGMGSLSLEALEERDYPVFLGLLSVTSILGLAGQIVSDLCCAVVDPRIRFDK